MFFFGMMELMMRHRWDLGILQSKFQILSYQLRRGTFNYQYTRATASSWGIIGRCDPRCAVLLYHLLTVHELLFVEAVII